MIRRSMTLAAIVCASCWCTTATDLHAQTSRPAGKDEGQTSAKLELGPFTAPLAKGWKSETPSSGMRRAQAKLPAPKGEGGDAELVVFHFPGTGGTVEANITRWKGQFEKPAGVSEEEFAKTTTKMVDDLPVTILDVRGKYLGSRMPGGPAPTPIDDARMLAVIVETSEGPYFIKITGPRATIDHHEKQIEAMVAGVKRGPKEPKGAAPKGNGHGEGGKPTSRPRGR